MKNIGFFFSLSHFLGVIMVDIFLCLIQSLFLPMYMCTPFNTQRHICTHMHQRGSQDIYCSACFKNINMVGRFFNLNACRSLDVLLFFSMYHNVTIYRLIFLCIYIYTHTHTRLYIYVCVHIYLYMYIFCQCGQWASQMTQW